MTVVWVLMLVCSLLCALWTGQVPALGAAALEGGRAAVELGLSLAGPLCLWSGVGTLMTRAGMVSFLSRLFGPLLRRLYPRASRDRETMTCLCGNLAANLLGLGSAATPMGAAAVRRMRQSAGADTADDEMCLLIVANTASIQLLPTTVAAVRQSLGAAAPFDILPAVWLSSALSLTAGILAARGLARIWPA